MTRERSPAPDGVFRVCEYALPSGANNNPNFALEFLVHGTDWNDDAQVDDVIVKGAA